MRLSSSEAAPDRIMDQPPSDLTQLLKAWRGGDERALEQLARVVECELRIIARAHLRNKTAHTLQPTALMNEVYVRLMSWNTEWQNRTHFFAVASKIMRRVLVNHAIAQNRQKRGGEAVLVSLSAADGVPGRTEDVLMLDEALAALEMFDSRKSRVVELRFFGGLTAEETAEALGISLRTVHREWDLARTWLFRELRGKAGKGGERQRTSSSGT
jgi:RNA polymerase sigma factor (TIGR02999 family)